MKKNEGWAAKEVAHQYMKIVDVAIPYRKEILSIIAGLATAFVTERPKVLDLGCGYGDVTAEVLKMKPEASVCLVDFSDEMIRLSSERFKDNLGIRLVKHDLNTGITDTAIGKGFDVVVSCFALHHIEFTNRVKLYSEIREALNEDGLFINGDRFKEDSPVIDEWVFNDWISYRVQQIRKKLGKETTLAEEKQTQNVSDKKLGDKPGTIWDMQRDLKKAGFRHVDCLWKYQTLAIIAAAK
ncbi:MAG: class I SAM-dependent methyltransferase [Chloroflexota bacterium]|nr:MAG: class I SAM-dependent methyltransferase [Chloroflexota bacterium]